jgi:hypothetical protein
MSDPLASLLTMQSERARQRKQEKKRLQREERRRELRIHDDAPRALSERWRARPWAAAHGAHGRYRSAPREVRGVW